MKQALLILICFASFHLSANMASPVRRGTLGTRPFLNEFVDVLHEDLFIKVDKNFETAKFRVVYHIKSSEDGVKIPFLFYASEFMEDFSIRIDGTEVNTTVIPPEFKVPEGTKFNNFSYFFEPSSYNDRSTVTLYESNSGGRSLSMRDMIYFESDISEGTHEIEVTYTAQRWIDHGDWIKEYSFRYALSPARYWKSFGTLTVELDATQFNQKITSNLGKPSAGKIDSIAIWEFDKLPIEMAQWSYQRPMKPVVKKLVQIGPTGLALITAIILAIVHYFWVRFYRKRHPAVRVSFPVIIGSLIVTSVFSYFSMYYYDVIDGLIGSDAGQHHGYTFGFVLLSPILFIVYLTIFWLIDKDFKKGPKEDIAD